MKNLLIASLLVLTSSSVFAEGPYSVSTTKIGVLLEDPKALSVLEKHIPQTLENSQFSTAASNLTLGYISAYDKSGELSKENLKVIDNELKKIGSDE